MVSGAGPRRIPGLAPGLRRDEIEAMRIFVTGATGVVGRRLVPLLLSAGHAVTAVARSQEKRAALERQGAAAVEVERNWRARLSCDSSA